MATWRYKISLLVLKNMSHISVRPCNTLYNMTKQQSVTLSVNAHFIRLIFPSNIQDNIGRPSGLSLRGKGGGRGFAPATQSMGPGYFRR